MDLLTFISDSERRAQLAADIGSSPDYLWQVATGRRRASTDLAQRIAEHSPVSKESLRPDVWHSKKPQKAA